MSIDCNIFRWYRSGWGRYTQSDPMGLAGGVNLYRYAEGNPLTNIDSLGLSPRPLPPSRTGTRPCTNEEQRICESKCPNGMESCRVSRTFRLVRTVNGLGEYRWADGPMSCSCKEPSCLDRLRDWARDLPPLPLIPIPPEWLPREPVLPGLPPFFVNPCLLNPSLPCSGSGGPGGVI